jgi:hypothetical protein
MIRRRTSFLWKAVQAWPGAALPALALSGAAPALAQSGPPGHELPRVDRAEVVLDGRLDEAAWRDAPALILSHQLQPNEGESPTEGTEVRVFYDEEALYIGARLNERDPSRITDRTLERNSFHRFDQDGFGVVLDTNGDQRTAFGFIVTPSGARTDVAVFDEARVGWNTDWNAFWDAVSRRDDGGWTVEMRIPFSSLRFEPDADGAVRMGLILWRYLARNDEFAVFPEIPNNWGNSAYKPGAATPVVFRGIEPRSPLYIKPYLMAGIERRNRLVEGGGAYAGERDAAYDVGADVKYNVTGNLVLDVTVNTDFAQVEADDERFNLERFSLFFPEKRDFFQERADLFNYRLPGGSERLFHSRQIGIADGRPIPLHGGARLTGRHGDWELGLLNMQTGRARVNGAEIPSENFGVARVQRPVLDRGSYLGGLFTSRSDLDGAHNFVYALDADLHLGGDHFMGLQAARSMDRGTDAQEGTGTIILQRRINRGLSFGHSFGHVGPGFRPAVGFLGRAGINRWGHRTQYTWFPGTDRSIQNHSLAHRFEFVWDDRFRVLETNTSSLTWDLRFRDGASARSQLEYSRELLESGFQVGGLTIPPGTYRFVAGSLRYGSPSGSDFRFGAELGGGGYFGGHRLGASVDLAWTPGPYLSLGLENVLNRIEVPGGSEDVLISRLRLGTALSRQITAGAFVQHNSLERIVTPNVRIRYNPREGSDLFLVYNEGINTALAPRDPFLPRLPRSQLRSVQLKYTYTFVQ